MKWREDIPKPNLEGNMIRLDRKQYLEALRLQLDMEPWEFDKAIGGLIKNGVIRFVPGETVTSLPVA